ncbi:MAG: hypothetical protein RJA49_788 [Actinomycetota bacterium]
MPDFDDDELDRRIRAVVGDAGSDAPRATPMGTVAPVSPDHRRWWAAAAAVVLVAGGVVALAVRHEPDGAAPTTSALPSTSAPSTSVDPAQDCDAIAPAQYDNEGSIHTILSNPQPIDVSVTFSPSAWCSGGRATVTITFTNHGVGIEHLQDPQLILNGGMAKWPIATLAAIDLAPGEHREVTTNVLVPNAPPGSYFVHIYGFDGGAQVGVRGAVACDGTNLSAAVDVPDDVGSMRNNLVVTNISDSPCLLTTPWAVIALTGTNGFTQIPFEQRAFFGDPEALPTRVLQAGERALMFIRVANEGCADPTKTYTWDRLQFWFGAPVGTTDLKADVHFPSPACGLFISAWGSPTP